MQKEQNIKSTVFANTKSFASNTRKYHSPYVFFSPQKSSSYSDILKGGLKIVSFNL